MEHPSFPFVGAGEANYFEWAEMFVCFAREPTPAEAAAITKGVPAPLRDTIEWNGPLLWVASEQGVGRVIKAAYQKKPGKPSQLTTNSRFAMAPDSAYHRFNADIDAWLEAANAKVPILVAYRREDFEAGATALSDWHRASVAQVPKLLEKLDYDDPELAKLALRLIDAAKLKDRKLTARLEGIVAAAKDEEADERAAEWEAQKAKAAAALGEPAPPYTKLRSDVKLDAKPLPATAKRLARNKELAVRPGASAAALAAAEKQLGQKLTKPHRALLESFDGGQIGELVILGTAKGGAVRDAEVATFSRAWSGDEANYVIVARTGREDVIALAGGKVYVMRGTPGWGGGQILRQCKTLDIALDLALKTGKVSR